MLPSIWSYTFDRHRTSPECGQRRDISYRYEDFAVRWRAAHMPLDCRKAGRGSPRPSAGMVVILKTCSRAPGRRLVRAPSHAVITFGAQTAEVQQLGRVFLYRSSLRWHAALCVPMKSQTPWKLACFAGKVSLRHYKPFLEFKRGKHVSKNKHHVCHEQLLVSSFGC